MATFKKESGRSKLSKKLLSIALAASMMCGTGALAGTVATVSNLPVSAVSATLADNSGTLQPLAANATFKASGVTYKLLTATVSETQTPTAAIIALDKASFGTKTSLTLGGSVTLTYKDIDGARAKTTVTVTQIGDGSNSLIADWPSDSKNKVKTVQIASTVTTISSNALKDVFKLYNSSESGSVKPKLILGDKGDLYGMALTTFSATGLPETDFVVETQCLNVVAPTVNDYGYLANFNANWTYRAYWGSYAWSKYMTKFPSSTKFENVDTISLTNGVKDTKTGATYAFYLAAPNASGSGSGIYVTGPRTPSAITSGGEWRMFAFNAGCNVLGQTEANYGTASKIFTSNGYSGTLAGSGVGRGLNAVLDLTIDMYNASVKFTPKAGVKVFSGTTEWKMKKTDASGNLVPNTINITQSNSDIVEILTKKSKYEYTNSTIDPELATRVGNTVALGYKLSGDYGTGLLLLAGTGYCNTSSNSLSVAIYSPTSATQSYYNYNNSTPKKLTSSSSKYYHKPTFYAENYYIESTSNSTSSTTATTKFTFGERYSYSSGSGTSSSNSYTECAYNMSSSSANTYFGVTTLSDAYTSMYLPLSGSYIYSVDKEKENNTTATVAYANSVNTKVTGGYCSIALQGLTPGYTYQLLYTSMKSSSFDSEIVNNFESKWLNKWNLVKTGGFDKNGKYTVEANGATTLTVSQAFAAKDDVGYMICLKTFDPKGNEVRKSYGVVNSGDMRAYIATTDPTTNKVTKVYKNTTASKVYATDSSISNGYTATNTTLELGVLVENNSGANLISNMKSTIYAVDSLGVVTNLGTTGAFMLPETTTTTKYGLFGQDTTNRRALYALSKTTISTTKLYDLGIGKFTLYVTKPTYSSTSLSLLNKESLNVNGTVTDVVKVATINITELGFKLAKTSTKATDGVGMTITTNGMSFDKYTLQEYNGTSWSDVPSMSTTSGLVLTAANGFTSTSATILPVVGNHTYRIKGTVTVGSTTMNCYSNVQTVKVTSGFTNYPTLQIGTDIIYNGGEKTQKENAAGTSKDSFVDKTQIKNIRMANATDGVDIKLTGLATGDVYGLNSGTNVTTTFYIANGTGLVASNVSTWGVDMLGDVVLGPKNALNTANVVKPDGTSAVSGSGASWYTLTATSFRIKATGSYFVKAVSTFTDSSGTAKTNTRYYYFNVTG